MADLTLVQGIADLRLNETTLRRDLQRARQLILQAARDAERQLRVDIPVSFDTSALPAEVRSLSQAISRLGISVTIPIEFETSNAAAARQSIEGGLGKLGLDRIRSDLAVLEDEGIDFDFLVDADTRPFDAALEGLRDDASETITTEIDADTLPAQSRLEKLLGPDVADLLVPVDGDPSPLQQRLDNIRTEVGGGPPLVPPIDLDEGVVDEFGDYAAGILPDDFGRAGEDSGRSFGQAAVGAIQGIFTTSSVALGGFLALSLTRGFQRFTTIQDSIASLTVQLGDATQAATLLDEVLGVVTGTPFDLDQFAEAASNLVAFGVEAEKIPNYLTAISEVAATRGGRANEYAQRLAISFGQVAVQGRITNDEINQLALTGVPALQILGNELNVTSGEARELISKGLVPANEALDALALGILEGSDGINGATVAFAGTAEALRETLTGSIGGFRSATARFGVSIIEPIEGILIAGFQGATAAVDAFGDEVERVLGDFADSDGVETFIEFLQDLPSYAETAVDAFQGLGPALAPLAAIVGGLGLGQLAGLSPLLSFLPGITGPLGVVVTGLGALIATTPELRDEFLPIIVQIGETAAEVAVILGPVLADAIDESIPLFATLLDIVGDLLPVFGDVAVGGASVLGVFAGVLGDIAGILNAFPEPVLTGIVGALLTIATIRATTQPLFNIASAFTAIGTAARGVPGRIGGITESLAVFRGEANNTERVAVASATAIAGAFAGMALAADDASTQVTGAIGAIGAIAAGAATGGGIGAAVAAVSVGVGLIAGEFINARQEAEAFERTVTASAKEIVGELTEVEIAAGATFDGFDIRSDQRTIDDFVNAFGDDLQERLEQIPNFGLNELLSFNVENLDEATSTLDQLRDTISRIRQADELGGYEYLFNTELFPPEFSQATDRLPETFEEIARAAGSAATSYEALSEVDPIKAGAFQRQVDANIEINGLLDDQRRLLGEVNDLGLPVTKDIESIEILSGLLSDRADAQQTVIDKYNLEVAAITDAQNAAEGYTREQLERLNLTSDTIDQLIEKYRDTDVNIVDLFPTGDEIVENLAGLDAELAAIRGSVYEVEEAAYDTEAAFEAWEIALEAVDESLAAVDDNLGLISARGDVAAALRGVGEGLGEIINEAELRKAERIADQVDRQLERVEDAADRLQEAALEFSFDEQIALANIAEAEAFGDFKGATAARKALELDRLEVQQLADDVADEERKLAELRQEADALGSVVPVTFGDVLREQAAAQGVSLFDLLLTQTTDESQQAFKQFVEGPANAALQEIGLLLDQGDLEGAAALAASYSDRFEREWSAQFGPGVGERLVDEIFNTEDFETNAKVAGDLYANVLADNVDLTLEDYIAEIRTSLSDPDYAVNEALTFIEIVQGILNQDDGELIVNLGFDPEQVALALAEAQAAADAREAQIQFQADLERDRDAGILGDDFRVIQIRDGSINRFKEGGFFGGPEAHTAHIADSLRVFGEPETGGEAYIPLTSHPTQRARSEALLGQVADIFGMSITPTERIEVADRRQWSAPMSSGPVTAVVANTDRIADAVADAVSRAMVTKRKEAVADGYRHAVHVENLNVGSQGSDRRTARRLINDLADLSLRGGR